MLFTYYGSTLVDDQVEWSRGVATDRHRCGRAIIPSPRGKGVRPIMTTRTRYSLGITVYAVLALGLALLASTSNAATPAQIYKCVDKNHRVLYTDEPCQGGELLNIRAGEADPAALARLERAREALEQRAAQRNADERRAAEQREIAAWYARENAQAAYDYSVATTPYASGVTWWYPGFVRPYPHRSRPPKLPDTRRFMPKSPPMAPRR
jgi:hypothetical protein